MDKYDSLNYVIYVPPLTSSAGIRALYRLSVELEKRGLSAPILCYKKTDGYHCINAFTKEMQENDIVIYPEVVRGNPLGFFRVVRYVLYYPGKLGGDTFFDKHEYIVSWSDEYYSGARVLSIPLIDHTLFYDAKLPKTHDSIFRHKDYGVHWTIKTDNVVEITMTYPQSRKELARMLQTTRVLYSFDHNSMLNDEALLCGAQVMLVTNEGLIPYRGSYTTEEKFQNQLEEFIKDTQKLNKNVYINKNNIKFKYKFKLLIYEILYKISHRPYFIHRIAKYRIRFGIASEEIDLFKD